MLTSRAIPIESDGKGRLAAGDHDAVSRTDFPVHPGAGKRIDGVAASFDARWRKSATGRRSAVIQEASSRPQSGKSVSNALATWSPMLP
jgi:hypothetical protein